MRVIALLVSFTLLLGTIWAAGSSDPSVRQVARSAWGFGTYALGFTLLVAAVLS